jgi:hypothetical protein
VPPLTGPDRAAPLLVGRGKRSGINTKADDPGAATERTLEDALGRMCPGPGVVSGVVDVRGELRMRRLP